MPPKSRNFRPPDMGRRKLFYGRNLSEKGRHDSVIFVHYMSLEKMGEKTAPGALPLHGAATLQLSPADLV